jgi:hypothetical protein
MTSMTDAAAEVVAEKTKLAPKLSRFALGLRTIKGKSGLTYIWMKTGNGSFHVFAETDAKKAARDCGATREGNTRQMSAQVFSD